MEISVGIRVILRFGLPVLKNWHLYDYSVAGLVLIIIIITTQTQVGAWEYRTRAFLEQEATFRNFSPEWNTTCRASYLASYFEERNNRGYLIRDHFAIRNEVSYYLLTGKRMVFDKEHLYTIDA